MSDRMIPIPFHRLMNWILTEKETKGTVFGVRKPYVHKPGKELSMFSEKLETPFGPAAGPNTQLAQNIIASYYAGSRFFELKTVQILDGEELPVSKPCILAEDEGYNVEWSTELYVPQAFDEYVKAWWACKLMALEFELGNPDGFMFNMSVGYDLEGICSQKIDCFIEGLKHAENTPIWKECKDYALNHLSLFKKVKQEDILNFSPAVCTSITLSTLHGCPSKEIERIAAYLLTKKGLNTFIKCNPTLLGYEYARKTMDEMGYHDIAFGEFHFKDDLQYADAVPMLKRLQALAEDRALAFGVKLTNTFPVDIKRNELPGEEMYMSGRSLYPLTISVAAKLSKDFDGKLRISYSGGADSFNIEKIFRLGIWPITIATTVLKPGGYERMLQIADILTKNEYKPFTGVDVAGLKRLCEEGKKDKHHIKQVKPLPNRKINEKVPLADCFLAPCQEGCPIHQDITAYMKLAGEGRYEEAMKVIALKNPLPFITGTICAHQCMGRCTRNFYEEPVHIRSMKLLSAKGGYAAFVQYIREEAKKVIKRQETGMVAVVGGGPAGLAASYFLARAGVDVTLFEKRDSLGGMIRHVIPKFRIPETEILKDVALVEAMGVKFKLNSLVESVDELKAMGFQFVIFAVGASKPGVLRLEKGESIHALDFLEQFKNQPERLTLGRNVVVIGGGNTAMDTARAAKRAKGVEHTYLVYRRTKQFMPADEEELLLTLKDLVEFRELLAPISLENGRLICRKMVLGGYDASGRREPKETCELVEIPADTVIAAVGEKVDSAYYQSVGIEVDERGKAKVNPVTLETSLSKVYVAGDGLSGPATVVEAIRDAAKAADAILKRMNLLNAVNESPIVKDACEIIGKVRTAVNTAEVLSKRGKLEVPDSSSKMGDGARCLQCPTICENCAEVCPNRANIAVKVPGMEMDQIVHVDSMCNECGNCQVFCPYNSAPYKEKLTLFADVKGFMDSENQGFVLLDEEKKLFRVRLDGKISEEAVFEDSCALPGAIKSIISAVFKEYRYMIL